MTARATIEALARQPFMRMVERGSDGVFTAWVLEVPGAISEGGTAEEALENLEDALTGVIGVMLTDGQTIPEPIDARHYSGRLQLRLLPSLHRRAAMRAEAEGVSLKRVLADAVAVFVGLAPAVRRPAAAARKSAQRPPRRAR